jgi:hypothetical protein
LGIRSSDEIDRRRVLKRTMPVSLIGADGSTVTTAGIAPGEAGALQG